MIKTEYLEEKDVEEFRESGLLWFINTTLHAFGWALMAVPVHVTDDDGEYVKNILLPARTKFRGFSVESNDAGYKKVAKYIANNAQSILEDADYEEEENEEGVADDETIQD